MKRGRLYKSIIVTLIVLLIILFILSFIIGKRIVDNEKNTPIYSTIEEMPDVKTLINQMYGKYIKMEDSTEEKYYKDIYVDLKYGLYDGETSKESFFNSIVQTVSQMMLYQNTKVIDEEKGIELKIVCDYENQGIIGCYINGDTNFYGHFESQKALANYSKPKITEFTIDSVEINTLIQNEWSKDKLSIGNALPQTEDYIEYPEFGIDIYEIDEKVFNILFDARYKAPVINGIKVGESLENVINILGTPTFGSIEEGYIGYVGNDLYAFFNDIEEISIYPKEKVNTDISQLIEEFKQEGSIKKLVSSATDIWENYEEYYYDEDTVNLTYPLAGIKFQFGVTPNHGIIIYSNYEGKVLNNYTQEELTNLEIEIPSYVYFVQEDTVDEYESERYYALKNVVYVEKGDYEEDDAWKYI